MQSTVHHSGQTVLVATNNFAKPLAIAFECEALHPKI